MSSYDIQINGSKADHYDLEDAARVGKVYQAGDSAFEHARKKLGKLGERGSKSRLTDAREARASIDRGIQQMMAAEPEEEIETGCLSINGWGLGPYYYGKA